VDVIGNALLSKLRQVAVMDDDDAVGAAVASATVAAAATAGGRGGKKGVRAAGAASAAAAAATATTQPAWMKTLAAKATEWLGALPKVRSHGPPRLPILRVTHANECG
jgi:hypothetical protein